MAAGLNTGLVVSGVSTGAVVEARPSDGKSPPRFPGSRKVRAKRGKYTAVACAILKVASGFLHRNLEVAFRMPF